MIRQFITSFFILISLFFSPFAHADYFYQSHDKYDPLKTKNSLDLTDDKMYNKKNYTRMGYKTHFNNAMILGGELVIDEIDFKKLMKNLSLDDLSMDLLALSSFSLYDKLDLYGKLGFSKNAANFDPKMVMGTSYAFNQNLSLNTNVTRVKRSNLASGAMPSTSPFGDDTTAAVGFKLKW